MGLIIWDPTSNLYSSLLFRHYPTFPFLFTWPGPPWDHPGTTLDTLVRYLNIPKMTRNWKCINKKKPNRKYSYFIENLFILKRTFDYKYHWNEVLSLCSRFSTDLLLTHKWQYVPSMVCIYTVVGRVSRCRRCLSPSIDVRTFSLGEYIRGLSRKNGWKKGSNGRGLRVIFFIFSCWKGTPSYLYPGLLT